MNFKKNNHIARLDNSFVDNARYHLSAREAKVIIFLVSRIDPIRQNRLNEQIISVKELEEILKGDGKKWGGLYKEMEEFQLRMMDRKITIPSNIEIDGKLLPGRMNWFQYISPVRMEDGCVGVSFLFSQPLQAAFLDLKKYVAIELLDIIPLKSAFSIRMFQIFRAYRNKVANYQKHSKKYYEVEELKSLLGIEGKYKDFSNFRKRVLNVIEREITKHTSISVKYRVKKAGVKAVGVEFEFWDKGNRHHHPSPTNLETKNFEALTFAQVKAFDLLVAYGVNEGIVMEMIAKCQGSEIRGFEDWYFLEVIRIFESKTSQEGEGAKAGTLVNWFLKKKVFEQGDMFAKIIETLQQKKKALQSEQPKNWDNRLLARDMSAEAFKKKVRS